MQVDPKGSSPAIATKARDFPVGRHQAAGLTLMSCSGLLGCWAVIKAVSALRLAVADVERSLDFYKTLGFQEIPGEGSTREVRSNWFRIRLENREPARGSEGLRICISVDDVNGYAAHLESNGIRVARETTGKSQELIVADPDGYSLLFFATKGSAQKSQRSHQAVS